MRRAIREHLRDFIAIATLLVLGLAATVVILSQQQAPYPSWVPLLGDDTFELKGEFTSAQAVTPGQGQTVDIAGVKVGDITNVDLVDGTAVVTMRVEDKYQSLIHPDATMLLRPRTGLQDMTIELDPGTKGKEVADGATIPLAQTQPNIQPDQILASLDSETRDYLQLLLQGGAKGLGGNGRPLSATLRRLDPTARDLAKINGKLSERRQNIRRVITNFKVLAQQLGGRDTQLEQFVSSSDAALGAFARQEASIRSALQELPSTLSETHKALTSGDKLALQLGPAARALIPSAKATGPALRATRPFFRKTVGPIRNQIKPFSHKVQPPFRHLAKAADALSKTSPQLTHAFGDLNQLLNALAFDPAGSKQGYLFYSAWLNHDTNSLFSLQDAQGPLRRGLVLQSCQTDKNAEFLTADPGHAFLRTIQELTNVPKSSEICP
jgi:phospholipid/cholesterol/gamma-HCH transport system substrate-binding protein